MRTDSAVRAAIVPATADQSDAAAALADALKLPLLSEMTLPRQVDAYELLLLLSTAGPALQLTGPKAPGPVTVDFGSSSLRHRRRGGHNELLGKAVGLGRRPELDVLDATAGLGRDAFVLADLGCRVTLCERNPLIHYLLDRGLLAARESPDPWLRQVVARMALARGDARDQDVSARPCDVIYLDPMFPQRGKSAAVKKEMALFQHLLGDSTADDEQLLQWALAQPVARVVVKRPAKAPPLGARQPSHVIRGKAVRFDVHVLRGLS